MRLKRVEVRLRPLKISVLEALLSHGAGVFETTRPRALWRCPPVSHSNQNKWS